MVLAVGDSAVTCYRQSLYNAKPTCPPSRHDDCTQAAWVCHWQSTGQAKSYSVDVGVQQGISELSTLFSGKTAILRQSLWDTCALFGRLRRATQSDPYSWNSRTLSRSGSLTADSWSSIRIEFFANSSADPSDFGQGQTFLGFQNVTTDSTGAVSFTFVASASLPLGEPVSDHVVLVIMEN